MTLDAAGPEASSPAGRGHGANRPGTGSTAAGAAAAKGPDPAEVAAAVYVSLSLLVRRLRQMPAPGDLSLPERSALARLDRGGRPPRASWPGGSRSPRRGWARR